MFTLQNNLPIFAHLYGLMNRIMKFTDNLTMRVVAEIPNPACKITIYQWNNRYIIKLERGLLEQTFKVDQFDLASEQEVYKIIDDKFLQQASSRFLEMEKCLYEAIQRI